MLCMLILFIAMSFECALGIEMANVGTGNKSEIQTIKEKTDHKSGFNKEDTTGDMQYLQKNRMSIGNPHLR